MSPIWKVLCHLARIEFQTAEQDFRDRVLNWAGRLLVFLEAYADETGTHDDTGRQPGSEVAGVCGYIAWADDWQKFCGEWQQVLASHGVRRFHFAEFADVTNGPRKPDWPYRGWSNEKRDSFLNTLAIIAGKRIQRGIAALVSVRDYERIMPPHLKATYPRPYYFCLQAFLEGILEYAKSSLPLPYSASTRFSVCLDRTTFPPGSAYVIYNMLKERRDFDNRLAQITFADSRNVLPLQAADLLAYRARQITTKVLRGGQPLNLTKLEQQLGGKKIMARYSRARNLRELLAQSGAENRRSQ